MAKWIARLSDNAWMVQGHGDPALIHTQPGGYTEVDCPFDHCPNPKTERWDSTSSTKCRPATLVEIAAYDAAIVSANAQVTSRDKDVLATCALIVRTRNIPAWDSMTVAKKVSATLAEADIWKSIREFIDNKV